MSRLLLRILVGVFLTMVAGSGLRIALFANFYGHFFKDPSWYPIQSTVTLIQDIIEHTPLQKIDEEKDFLIAILNRRIDIVDAGDPLVPIELRQQLPDGKPVFWSAEDGKGMFCAPVHNHTKLILFVPSFQSYRPSFMPLDFVAAFVWVSLVAAMIGFLLSFPLNRRLKQLESTVEQIRQGNTCVRTKAGGSDLIGSVTQYFNQMAERIQQMIANRRNLLTATTLAFQSAVSKSSSLANELLRAKNPSAIKTNVQKIDEVIDDLDQVVRGLLLQEKNVGSGSGPAVDAGPPSQKNDPSMQSALRKGIRKFFIRTSFGILIALFCNHLFGLFMSQIGFRNISLDPNWSPLRTTAALIQRAIDLSSLQELPRRLETLRTSLNKRIDYLPGGQGTPLAGSVQIESGDEITYGDYGGRKVFFAPVQSGTGILVIDLGIHMYRGAPSFLWHLFCLPAEFLFTILGTLLLSLPIIANIKKLAAGIQSVKEGDLTTRVDVPLNRPIGKLAGAFNEMAERVQSMLNQHRHLIRAVAHEVRTPVSRIRFHLEMLTGKDGFPEAGRVKDILEEIRELRLLTRELQTFTFLDSPDESLEKASIPLHDVLREIVAYFQKTHGALSFVLSSPATKAVTVSAHPVYFRRAIQNILSNAVRYARKRVSIHFHSTPSGIFIDIRDDGPGIPMDARNAVFDPFVRLDSSRNRKIGGFGLGLAIVKGILSLHGGYVSIAGDGAQRTTINTFWPHPIPPPTPPSDTN